jgi:hypothetical protein
VRYWQRRLARMLKELEAIFDRLGRAEEHLEAIKCRLLRHYEADKYRLTGEYQRQFDSPQGIIVTDPVTFPEIDPRLNTIIGELLHDLRSALDHLAWQLVLNAGGIPTDDTKFPIEAPSTNPQGKQGNPGVAGGVSRNAKTLIASAQPYKRGVRYREHPLWLLHKLWNIDKHRHVLAGGSFGSYVFPLGAPTFRFASKLDSATPHSAKFLLVPSDPSVNVDAHATVEVAIHEPDDGIEQPLLGTLESIDKAVVDLIAEAESRCF